MSEPRFPQTDAKWWILGVILAVIGGLWLLNRDTGEPDAATPLLSAPSTERSAPTLVIPEADEVPMCVSWEDAREFIGISPGVCGVVTMTFDDPGSAARFINFTSDRSAYYAVTFKGCDWGPLEGRCVRIDGPVELYKGKPQTVIEKCNQLEVYWPCP